MLSELKETSVYYENMNYFWYKKIGSLSIICLPNGDDFYLRRYVMSWSKTKETILYLKICLYLINIAIEVYG